MSEDRRRCCGIDLRKNSVTVCVLAPLGERHIETKKRKFRTFTRDLKELRAWLKNCRVTEIHLACALRAGCDVLLSWDGPLTSIKHEKIRIEKPRMIGQARLPLIVASGDLDANSTSTKPAPSTPPTAPMSQPSAVTTTPRNPAPSQPASVPVPATDPVTNAPPLPKSGNGSGSADSTSEPSVEMQAAPPAHPIARRSAGAASQLPVCRPERSRWRGGYAWCVGQVFSGQELIALPIEDASPADASGFLLVSLSKMARPALSIPSVPLCHSFGSRHFRSRLATIHSELASFR